MCYDTLGNVTQIVDAKGNPTSFDYAENWADTYCIPAGTITHAFPKTITDALGHRTNTTRYTCTALSSAVADENDIRAGRAGRTYTYDWARRPLCVNLPDGGQTCTSYFLTAQPPYSTQTTLITSSLSSATKTIMDGYGRATQNQLTSDPEGVDYTDITYDAQGHTASLSNPYRGTSDPTYGVTLYYYDALGRSTSLVEPDGSAIKTSYSGNCATITDEGLKTRKSCSDGPGRLTQIFEAPTGPGALNYETDYQYDALDNLTRVDEKGGDSNSANWRTRLFQYDSLSRLTSASNPESGTIAYYYDNNNNLSSKVAPQPNQTGSLTVTTNYNYDALNRLTQKSYVGMSTPLAKYGYDGTTLSGCTNTPPTLADTNPFGRRTAMCDGSGAASWSHDQMGRSLTEQRKIIGSSAVTKSIGYLYNKDGSVLQITYPSGKTVTYTYSGAARALQAVDVANNVNYVTAATYTPPGGLLTYKNGVTGSFAGITVTNGYNNRLQPTVISAGTQTATFFSLGYGYGPANQNNGNPSTIVNNLLNASGRNQTFTYDALNRISTAQSQATSGTACWGQSFSIDPWGNLQTITATKCSPPILNAAADNKNHMIGFNYDAAGNLTKEGSGTPSWNYSWDAENRLSSISGSASDTFTYDGDGERVKRSYGALFWRQHGGPFLSKTNLSGSISSERIYFNGLHVAIAPPSGPAYYLFQDHLGGEHIVTDATGNVCQDIDTLPFGSEARFNTACDSSYRFAGLERDDEISSNLDYAIGRYYDNRLGRLMSPDPSRVLPLRAVNPQLWNQYAYGMNNPLSFSDPSGSDAGAVNFSGMVASLGHEGLLIISKDGTATYARFGPADHSAGNLFGALAPGVVSTFTNMPIVQFGSNGLPTEASIKALATAVAQDESAAGHTVDPNTVRINYFQTGSADTIILKTWAELQQEHAQSGQGMYGTYCIVNNNCATFTATGLIAGGAITAEQAKGLSVDPNQLFLQLSQFANINYDLLQMQQVKQPLKACTTIYGPDGPETHCE